MTISRITSQRFILHPPFSPFAAVFLVSGFFIPRRAAGKRDTDPGFVNRYNYGGFLRKWIDCGYSVGGDCEKGSGRLLTTWAFVYPVSGISGRVSGSGDIDYNDSLKLRSGAACRRVLVKSGKLAGGFVRDFSRRQQTPLEYTRKINELDALIWRSPAILTFRYNRILCGFCEWISGEDFFTGQVWCAVAEDWQCCWMNGYAGRQSNPLAWAVG